jgi:hypothetical protein
LVILQLGANHDLRRWPLRNYADLAAGLMAEKVRVACVGSEREHRLAHRLKRLLGPSGQKLIDLMGRTDLPTLAACLQIADLVVGADTGTLHLATAVGARVLALYMGPAAVHETGPYGSGHLVMQARDRCGPCREEDPVCQGEAPCRWLITPHMALTAARALLKGDSAAEAAGNLELPAGVQALEAGQDRFGQVYLNLTPQVMTASLAASLALRQAGRMLLRPDYDHDLNELDVELHGQYLPADDRERGEIAELGKAAADLSMAAAGGDISAARLAVQSEPCLWPMAEVVYRGEHPRLAQAAEAAAVTLEACRRF